MDRAGVGDQERPPETPVSQCERGLDSAPRLRIPVGWKRSARRGRERVEPKRDPTILRPCARSLDEGGKTRRLIGAFGPEIELETGPRIETDAIESLVKRSGIEPFEAKTVSPERAGEDDLQAVRSIGEVVERLGVRFVGVRMIEARDDPPGTAGSSSPRAFRWRLDGFDAKAIRSLPRERLDACAFERGFSGSAPIGLGIGRKKACDRAQRRLSLDELGKPGNRRGDFSHNLIARLFARVGEDFLSEGLDLLHAEAESQQFRAQRHQSAPAHRSARHAHQALQASAHALSASLRARGDDGRKGWRLLEQFRDGFLRGLALDEIANQSDGLARDIRAQLRGGRDAGYQIVHFIAPWPRGKPPAASLFRACGAEIKRHFDHSTSSASSVEVERSGLAEASRVVRNGRLFAAAHIAHCHEFFTYVNAD